MIFFIHLRQILKKCIKKDHRKHFSCDLFSNTGRKPIFRLFPYSCPEEATAFNTGNGILSFFFHGVFYRHTGHSGHIGRQKILSCFDNPDK